ncbi:response regulator [bacterium]|jgi:CheY-like chemotaxis protein|nr:response regulator [bacterium]
MVDLNKEIKNVLSDLDVRIESSEAIINLKELPSAYADPVQMRQLFLNLLSNSLKYCRSGIPPKINIKGYRPDKKNVSIVITDNGLGFDKKDASRMFLPFERLDNGTKISGTGIGLATVKKIIDRHNGTIHTISNLGKGSIFIITLQSVLSESKSTLPDEGCEDVFFHFESNIESKKILIAEDSLKYQTIFSTKLKELGYSFDIAENGLAALELYKKNQYDLIFMDCDMPVMDGFLSTDLIRAWEIKHNLSRCPIIIASQLITYEDIELYKDSGMDDCIPKPFSFDDLLDVFRVWLKKGD